MNNAKSESKKLTVDSLTVAFYNVENLYDVYDDPAKADEDFTVEGKYNWTEERYALKLERLADVYDALPGDLPVFVGMAEIENRRVLEDLVKETKLLKGHYQIIHQDSPDERGIDVAAIYDSANMQVQQYRYIPITLPDPTDRTRDILYVEATVKSERIHFFVNHWPSRRGGQAESEISRITVAAVLKGKIDSILKEDPKAKMLIMGDFNDYPMDKSISGVLMAGITQDDLLYNYMYTDHLEKRGSYFYKGEWGALDQFMATKSLKEANHGWKALAADAHIFKQKLVLFEDERGVSRPNHTYVGENYKGGYSDHLCIYLILKK